MKKLGLVALLLAAVAAIATAGAVASKDNSTFVAHLAGRNEVPPVDTNATGQSIFKLRGMEDTSMDYKLIVANIEDVVQAHIHCGAAGVNGPVVVFLFGPVAGIDANGILAEGTITPEDMISVPDSAACPGGVADFEELLAKIRSGDAYVNVHTVDNPGGEIRGQVR